MTEAWANVQSELDRIFDSGRTVRIWLRDDDCVAVTPALERLAALCSRLDLPILLAVIPEPAEPPLAGWIAAHPTVTPCQHGFAHRNHAAPGERARELGGQRPAETVLDELTQGRAILQALFGDRLSDILVPPWNRIDADLVARLPALGYSALSTFGPAGSDAMRHLNCDLDIIDWRNGRVGRPLDDLLRKLAGILGRAPLPSCDPLRSASGIAQTIGILTHHLAHDTTAWAALKELLERLRSHPAVAFTDATALGSAQPNHPPTRPPLP